MKSLLAALLALASLTSPATSALGLDFDKLVRDGDVVEFTQPVVFVNPAKYDSGYISVQGRTFADRTVRTFKVRCSLNARVAANSRATIQAGRKMVITETSGEIALESGVSISCQCKHDYETEWNDYMASAVESADLARSLPMIRIHRQPPPAPDDRDL